MMGLTLYLLAAMLVIICVSSHPETGAAAYYVMAGIFAIYGAAYIIADGKK